MNQSIEKAFTTQQTKYTMRRAFADAVMAKGFRYYEADAFEPYEAFMKINARVKEASMVKLIDYQGSILTLRPDVTTSLINRVIPHFTNGTALKLFYDTDIFYHKKNGAIDKSAQFGVEHLADSNHQAADIEIVELMINMLEGLNVDYTLEIGNRKFLDSIFSALNIDGDALRTLKQYIMEKSHSDLKKWQSTMDFNDKQIALLDALFKLEGSYQTIVKIVNALPEPARFKETLNDLERIEKALKSMDKQSSVTYDLSMLSQYDYYQGVTFLGYVSNVNRAVLKGGRYNPLNKTTNKRVPAIGFTLDMDLLIKAVMQHG